jgi:arylformamidase
MLIDISQEVFSCHVFPGDPAPQRTTLLSIKDGAVCNLTALSMCAHNGTHVDAPYHFIQDGKTIDRIPLDRFVGPCWVSRHEGPVSGQDAAAILDKARENSAEQRILIAGKATVTEEAAQVFGKLLGAVHLLRRRRQRLGRLPVLAHQSAGAGVGEDEGTVPVQGLVGLRLVEALRPFCGLALAVLDALVPFPGELLAAS